jgi:hypothetical protein
MVNVRRLLWVLCQWLCSTQNTSAQQVFFPANASAMLQSVATDFADILQRSTGKNITASAFATSLPDSGFVLMYDNNNPTSKQHCKVSSPKTNLIVFSASGDNNLHFGVYRYLFQLGFKFYLPGQNWELIPQLRSPYLTIDTVYTSAITYKGWFISGGYNTWVMDSNRSYYWDTYFGNNGHAWAQYQRRNDMMGNRRFAGHRDDIMAAGFLQTLQQQPCFVAPFNNSRAATGFSVPDVNNRQAMDAWASAIGQMHQQFKQTVFQNPVIHANHYRNYNYNRLNIGLEVPDGARWANSVVPNGCSEKAPLSAPNQHFTLANHSVQQLSPQHPDARFQLYAYDSHADVPSSLPINSLIDVQVVAGVYQNITSPAGLLNRWYKRHPAVSEYHYLNLAQWSGETPAFNLTELLQTINRVKEKNGQGVIWESGAGKFTCLPFLYAANLQLDSGIPVHQTLQQFCNDMFGKAAPSIYQLLMAWSNETTASTAHGPQDNRYKLSYYFQLLNQALLAAQNETDLVKVRLTELKAMLHYCKLYYQWAFSQEPVIQRQADAAVLCKFLAQTNHWQLVNSYAIINSIVHRFDVQGEFYKMYNTESGTAYASLQPLSGAAVNAIYAADNAALHHYETAFSTVPQIAQHLLQSETLEAISRIDFFMNYTQAKDFASQAVLHFVAEKPGHVEIALINTFNEAGKGYVNVVTELTDGQTILQDSSFDNRHKEVKLKISVPAAGNYSITISTKYKTAIQVKIITHGYQFYRKGPYLGNTIENYRANLESLPGYFYVPQHINRIYFSINNGNPGGSGFASQAAINKAFMFKDAVGKEVLAKLLSAQDSAYYYLDVPATQGGRFWRVANMEQYRLCFANISNYQWYAREKNCQAAQFDIKVSSNCNIILEAKNKQFPNSWEVLSAGNVSHYANITTLELPAGTSPNSKVTLKASIGCSYGMILQSNREFLSALTACVAGAPLSVSLSHVNLYPNPGSGIFYIQLNKQLVTVDRVQIFFADGRLAAQFQNCNQFNVSTLSAGQYFFRLIINGQAFNGKLQKQ